MSGIDIELIERDQDGFLKKYISIKINIDISLEVVYDPTLCSIEGYKNFIDNIRHRKTTLLKSVNIKYENNYISFYDDQKTKINAFQKANFCTQLETIISKDQFEELYLMDI